MKKPGSMKGKLGWTEWTQKKRERAKCVRILCILSYFCADSPEGRGNKWFILIETRNATVRTNGRFVCRMHSRQQGDKKDTLNGAFCRWTLESTLPDSQMLVYNWNKAQHGAAVDKRNNSPHCQQQIGQIVSLYHLCFMVNAVLCLQIRLFTFCTLATAAGGEGHEIFMLPSSTYSGFWGSWK